MWRASCRASGAVSIAIMLVLGLVAMTNAAPLEPFSEIQASPVTVTPDPSGRAAALEVETDLGSPTPVGVVIFGTRSMSDGSARTATFTVTADGTTYGPSPADEPCGELEDLGIVAQVLRIDVDTSSGGNTGATETVVFGSAQ